MDGDHLCDVVIDYILEVTKFERWEATISPFPPHSLLINSRGIAFWSNPTASFSVNYESDIITCLLRSRKWSLTIPSKFMNTKSWPFDVIADSGSCVGSVPSWSISVFLEMGKEPPKLSKTIALPIKDNPNFKSPPVENLFRRKVHLTAAGRRGRRRKRLMPWKLMTSTRRRPAVEVPNSL